MSYNTELQSNNEELEEILRQVNELPEAGSGESGADGFSPIATVTQTSNGATISITDKSGTTTATIVNGKDGKDGAKGDKGDTGATGPQGPQGIPGEKGDKGDTGATGSQGPKGDTGAQGPAGADGAKGDKGDKGDTGATGSQGPKGDKGDTGATGPQGPAGADGKDGADGYTPVKGVDYWTAADQEAIIQQVIDVMGGSVLGTVDANNNIVFRGYLANGAYTLKYEDADGNIVDCGTITVSTNESGGGSGGNDSGMGDSGSIPLTWSMGVKLDKNTGAEASGSGYAASSHVELVDGYAYTFNQLDNGYGNTYGGANICYYDASGNGIGYELLWDALSGVKSKVLTPISGAKTFRVRLYCGESTNEGIVRAYFTVTYAKV